jgi:hypothetical protein
MTPHHLWTLRRQYKDRYWDGVGPNVESHPMTSVWQRRVSDPQCGSGSSIFSKSRSGSSFGSRILITNNGKIKVFWSKIAIYLFLGSLKRTPKLQEKLSALKIEHPAFRNIKSFNFFMFLGSFLPFWIRTHILNADPDLDLANQINADQCGSGSVTLR